MIDPTIMTPKASVIANVIINNSREKENLSEALSSKIEQIINIVRDKFQIIGMEEIFSQIECNPTEKNRGFLQQTLEKYMSIDKDFRSKLIEVKKQFEKIEGSDEIMVCQLESKNDLNKKA